MNTVGVLQLPDVSAIPTTAPEQYTNIVSTTAVDGFHACYSIR